MSPLLKDEFCGANNGSGVAEECPNNGHGNQGSQQFLSQGKLHRLPPEFAGVRQATGDHHGFGVEDVDESAHGLARCCCANFDGTQSGGAATTKTGVSFAVEPVVSFRINQRKHAPRVQCL